jgi:hypothetical protein
VLLTPQLINVFPKTPFGLRWVVLVDVHKSCRACLGSQIGVGGGAIHVFVAEKLDGEHLFSILSSRCKCRLISSNTQQEELNQVALKLLIGKIVINVVSANMTARPSDLTKDSCTSNIACCECWVFKTVAGAKRHDTTDCDVKGRLRQLLSHYFIKFKVTSTFKEFIEGVYTSAETFCKFMATAEAKYLYKRHSLYCCWAADHVRDLAMIRSSPGFVLAFTVDSDAANPVFCMPEWC